MLTQIAKLRIAGKMRLFTALGEQIRSATPPNHDDRFVEPIPEPDRPALSSYLIRRSARAATLAAEKPALEQLTPTERRVVKLIAEGQTSREIAATLGIGVRTVEHHRNNIATKLDLRGSHALVKFAVEHQAEL